MAKIHQEARELIAFYDERGKDWTVALAFILCRHLFGRFAVARVDEGQCVRITRRRVTP
jgi:hypothetical protein